MSGLTIYFQFLNNITPIFIYFFTLAYFKRIQTTLLEQRYQMAPKTTKMPRKIKTNEIKWAGFENGAMNII